MGKDYKESDAYKGYEAIKLDIEQGEEVKLGDFNRAYDKYEVYLTLLIGQMGDNLWDIQAKYPIKAELKMLKSLKPSLEQKIKENAERKAGKKQEVVDETITGLKGKGITKEIFELIRLEQQEKDADIAIRFEIKEDFEVNYVENVTDFKDADFSLDGKDYGEFDKNDMNFYYKGLFLAARLQGGESAALALRKEFAAIFKLHGQDGLTFAALVENYGSKHLKDVVKKLLTYNLHDFDRPDVPDPESGGEYVMGYVVGCVSMAERTMSDSDAKEYEKYVFAQLESVKDEVAKQLKDSRRTETDAHEPTVERLMIEVIAKNILTPKNWKNAYYLGPTESAASAAEAAETPEHAADKYVKDVEAFSTSLATDPDASAEFGKSEVVKKAKEIKQALAPIPPTKIEFNEAEVRKAFYAEAHRISNYQQSKLNRIDGVFYGKLTEGIPRMSNLNEMLKNPLIDDKLKNAGISNSEAFKADYLTVSAILETKHKKPLNSAKDAITRSNALKAVQAFFNKYYFKIASTDFATDFATAAETEKRNDCTSLGPDNMCKEPARPAPAAPPAETPTATPTETPAETPTATTPTETPAEAPTATPSKPADKPREKPSQRDEMKSNPDKYITVSPDGVLTFKNGADKYITLGNFFKKGLNKGKFTTVKDGGRYIMVSLRGGGETYLAKMKGAEFHFVEGPERGKRAGIWNGSRIEKPNAETIHTLLGTEAPEGPKRIVPRVNETVERTDPMKEAEKKFADYLKPKLYAAMRAMLNGKPELVDKLMDECGNAASNVPLPAGLSKSTAHFRIHLAGFGDLQYHEGKILNQQGMAEGKRVMVSRLYVATRQKLRRQRVILRDKPEEWGELVANVRKSVAGLAKYNPHSEFFSDLLD